MYGLSVKILTSISSLSWEKRNESIVKDANDHNGMIMNARITVVRYIGCTLYIDTASLFAVWAVIEDAVSSALVSYQTFMWSWYSL